MTMGPTPGLVQVRIADMRRQADHGAPRARRATPGRWDRALDRIGVGLVRLGQRLQADPRPQVRGKTLPLGH